MLNRVGLAALFALALAGGAQAQPVIANTTGGPAANYILQGGTIIAGPGGFQQNNVTVLNASNNATLVGPGAGTGGISAGAQATAIGKNALASATGNSNVLAIGFDAGQSITTGSDITIVGTGAGTLLTTEINDQIFGVHAMGQATGSLNTCMGHYSCQYGTFSHDIALGEGTMNTNTPASTPIFTDDIAIGVGAISAAAVTEIDQMVAIGTFDGFNQVSGNNNTYVGYAAGQTETTGGGNTFLGSQAGNSATTASNNVALGLNAGTNLTTGSNNTIIGECGTAGCKSTVTTGSDNISIGHNKAVPSPTASDQLSIGNMIYGIGLSGSDATTSPGAIGIGTQAPNAALTIGSSGGTVDDGHIGVLATAPTGLTCGTSPTVSATATDVAGTITEGTGTPTSCVVPFAIAYQTAPSCVISSWAGNTNLISISAVTTAALTVSNTGGTTEKFSYHCIQ